MLFLVHKKPSKHSTLKYENFANKIKKIMIISSWNRSFFHYGVVKLCYVYIRIYKQKIIVQIEFFSDFRKEASAFSKAEVIGANCLHEC